MSECYQSCEYRVTPLLYENITISVGGSINGEKIRIRIMQENSKQVYVVDDDEIFHFILKKMLEQQAEKLEVTSFLCAEDAIAQLQLLQVNALPSLIILDMNMQRMNGWDFIEAYRDLESSIIQQIPIIMCSSSMDMRDLQKVKRTPELKAYITKPLDPSKVKVITDCLA